MSQFTTDAEREHQRAVQRVQQLRAQLDKAMADLNYSKGLLDMSRKRDEAIQEPEIGVNSVGTPHAD